MSKRQSLILCLLYFAGYLICFPAVESILLQLLSPAYSYRILNAFEWGFYLAFPFVMVKSVWPWLKREIYLFLDTPLKHLMTLVKTYGLMMLSSIALNLVLLLVFELENSGNQNSLIELYSVQPFKVLYASLIFAPIVEELVFRGALFSGLRKNHKVLGILFSSFAFGFLHVYQSLFTGDFKDLLFLFSYALLGSFMCRAYEKTGSIAGAMSLHFINNLVSVIVTFML
ncbi:MAG: CPBP family intramembrane metalloprotease [Erysipelotrichaceae bacterium]|nr:CPBP family intramembrane metalloprotease [Erysipelotrichaceae bacterium]